MNPFEFVLILMAMFFVFRVIKHRMGIPDSRPGRFHHGLPDAAASPDRLEAERLRDEVRQLKERMAVLERITVDKENSLAREIEDLRHK